MVRQCSHFEMSRWLRETASHANEPALTALQMSCLLTQQMSCLQTQRMSCLQTRHPSLDAHPPPNLDLPTQKWNQVTIWTYPEIPSHFCRSGTVSVRRTQPWWCQALGIPLLPGKQGYGGPLGHFGALGPFVPGPRGSPVVLAGQDAGAHGQAHASWLMIDPSM